MWGKELRHANNMQKRMGPKRESKRTQKGPNGYQKAPPWQSDVKHNCANTTHKSTKSNAKGATQTLKKGPKRNVKSPQTWKSDVKKQLCKQNPHIPRGLDWGGMAVGGGWGEDSNKKPKPQRPTPTHLSRTPPPKKGWEMREVEKVPRPPGAGGPWP